MLAHGNATPGDTGPAAGAQVGRPVTDRTPRADILAWRDCGHRADFPSAADHGRDCPAHGEAAQDWDDVPEPWATGFEW